MRTDLLESVSVARRFPRTGRGMGGIEETLNGTVITN